MTVRVKLVDYKPCESVVLFNDGSTASIQASQWHYCEPRAADAPVGYSQVEMWNCLPDPCLEPYGSETDPYAYVPAAVLRYYVEKRGGVSAASKTWLAFAEATNEQG